MIPVIVKLCESPSRAGGLLMINYYQKGMHQLLLFVITAQDDNISVKVIDLHGKNKMKNRSLWSSA